MRFQTMVGIIDVVILAVLTAAWFSYGGWPVLVIAAGVAVLLYVLYRVRLAQCSVSDDEAADAIAAAWSIADDGRMTHPLNMGTSDARGILTSLRGNGLAIVRIKPKTYPVGGTVWEPTEIVDLNVEDGPYRHYLSHPNWSSSP